MRKYYQASLIPLLISLGILLLTGLLYLQPTSLTTPLLQRLNALAYDLRMRATVTGTVSDFPPIYIIDIDEPSLLQEGQWPWKRHQLATLINKLYAAGTAVITLDITLAEPEDNPVDQVRRALPADQPELAATLATLHALLDGDQQLALAMQDKSVILGYLFHPQLNFSKGQIKPALVNNSIPLAQLSSLAMQGYTANLAGLAASAAQNGFFTIRPDDDGVVRKSALLLEYDGKLYTSLALETARLYLGAEQEAVQVATAQVADVQAITEVVFAGQRARTDARGQILIPYLGQQGVFPYISAADVLNEAAIPDLTDAIVVVGTSAQALADLRTTPLQASFPGVEIQASLIHALMNPDTIPFTPEWSDGATLLLLGGLALLMWLVFPGLRPVWLVIVGTGLMLVVTGFNVWLWVVPRINLDLVIPLLLIMATSTTFVLHRMFSEYDQRRRIHDMFGQYVPTGHIEQLLTGADAVSMAGERRQMTVLFSDIRNFTALSEHLSTEQLKQFLNHYLTPVTTIIFEHQGTIDKYIGDLVMAFWGAPLTDPQHAEHAVRAALAMQAKTRAMQPEFRALGLKQAITAGIGIHSGMMNVGDMGSSYRRAYTVLGDAVNLGSRLEGLTKFYHLTILVSADTLRECPGIYGRPIDHVRVKGRTEPLYIHEPLCLLTEKTPELEAQTEQHKQALQAYFQGDWATAWQAFSRLAQQTADPLYAVYLARIDAREQIAPANWDGIFSHESK